MNSLSSISENFFEYAELKCVVHNGTCWAACIAESLSIKPNGVAVVADNVIKMKDDPLLPKLVLDWITVFEAEFEKFCVAPRTRVLSEEAYVTNNVLQAYADNYSVSFIITNLEKNGGRGSRKAINIIDVIIPRTKYDVCAAVVIKAEGHRFDYYIARNECQRRFNEFTTNAINVSLDYT
jgi:hypothetical protein